MLSFSWHARHSNLLLAKQRINYRRFSHIWVPNKPDLNFWLLKQHRVIVKNCTELDRGKNFIFIEILVHDLLLGINFAFFMGLLRLLL